MAPIVTRCGWEDASGILYGGASRHSCLFFYGGAASKRNGKPGPSAARCGKWKAHWATGPGLGGCEGCTKESYPEVPLLFDIEEDPSEAYPLTDGQSMPKDAAVADAVRQINAAFDHEQAACICICICVRICMRVLSTPPLPKSRPRSLRAS
jgi:hypothetical protein